MKATEINLQKDGYRFSTRPRAAREHYKFLMRIGRGFPTTKSQAKFYIQEGVHPDVLNMDDVEAIESLMNKYGYEGEYRYTKSKNWVRLLNVSDLHKSLKIEFVNN